MQRCNNVTVIRRCLPALIGAAAVTSLALAPISGATTVATAAANCRVPHLGEHLGPTYLNALSVSGTSCGTGFAVVRAYHACQLKHGGVKARCSSSVDGFHCSEKRGPSIPTEFFSSVSCQNRSERVVYKYSQFT
jgi:hypothetical protein